MMRDQIHPGLLLCVGMGLLGFVPEYAQASSLRYEGRTVLEGQGGLRNFSPAERDTGAGYVDPQAVPGLIEALKDPDPRVRKNAFHAIGQVVPVGKNLVVAIVEAMRSADPYTREAAAEVWGSMGGLKTRIPHHVVVALAEDLTKGDVKTQVKAADALAAIQSGTKEGIAALERALKDPQVVVRLRAAVALGSIGPQAGDAVPALVQAMEDPEAEVRRSAAQAVGSMESQAKDAVPALAVALEDAESQVRRQAAESLGKIGWPAKSAAPELIRALTDPDAVVRAQAAYSLGYIQSRRDRRISAILDRSLAGRSLAVTPITGDAIPALAAALEDPSVDVREKAAQALGLFGEAGLDVVPELIRALNGRDGRVRVDAASALGRIGPRAEKAIPALEQALKDDDADVRQEAKKALTRVRSSLQGATSPLVGPGA